jgi:hypothetical protein
MVRFRPNILLAGTALALFAGPVTPSLAQDKLIGVPALAGAPARVSGALSVRETGPLARELEITVTEIATGTPLVEFEKELTQQLHVIVVDSALSTFIHEHAEEVDADGRFRVQVKFPKSGAYHVYADAVPAGLGQQVLRFDLPVGETGAASPATLAAPAEGALRSSDGPSTVELDASGLAAGREAEVRMRILRDGHPADDLEPYLVVPAHAVFIAAKDLAYVHAHAAAGAKEQSHRSRHGSHDPHAGHGASNPKGSVPPELTLHVTAPQRGAYALWVQFKGGGEVRTVPFAVAVSQRGS